jgi:hypothetical protein
MPFARLLHVGLCQYFNISPSSCTWIVEHLKILLLANFPPFYFPREKNALNVFNRSNFSKWLNKNIKLEGIFFKIKKIKKNWKVFLAKF